MSSAEPSQPNRRKLVVTVVSAFLAVVVAGAGVWFAAFSPKGSTVQVQPVSAAIAGKPVNVSGVVTPARSERVVRLSVAATSDGPWVVGATTVTDSTGHFTVSHTPASSGTLWVRATAVELERDQEATSGPVTVLVREVATLKLTAASSVARTDKPLSFSGVLKPAGQPVQLERSKDGDKWDVVQPAASTNARGVFTLVVKNAPAGSWQYRATTTENDVATAAESAPAKVLVEDYKAAGKKYLELVGPMNKTIVATNAAGGAYDGSPASFAALKKAAGAESAAFSKAARQFQDYPGWPRKVAPTVDSFVKGLVIEADYYNLMSKAATIDEFDMYLADIRDDQAKGSADAAALREALALPKRDPIP